MAFGVVKEVMVRKPILDEIGRVWVRSGEGIDLFFGEVLAVSEAKKKMRPARQA